MKESQDTGDVIFLRSCNFSKTLELFFRKCYAQQILAAGLATVTKFYVPTNLNNVGDVIMTSE